MGIVSALNYMLFENSGADQVATLLKRRGWLGSVSDKTYSLVSPRSKDSIGVVVSVHDDGQVVLTVPGGFLPVISGRLRAIQREPDIALGDYRLVFRNAREFSDYFPDLETSLARFSPFAVKAIKVLRQANTKLEDVMRGGSVVSYLHPQKLLALVKLKTSKSSPYIDLESRAHYPGYVITKVDHFHRLENKVEGRILKDIFSDPGKIVPGARRGEDSLSIRWDSLDAYATGFPKLVEYIAKQVEETYR